MYNIKSSNCLRFIVGERAPIKFIGLVVMVFDHRGPNIPKSTRILGLQFRCPMPNGIMNKSGQPRYRLKNFCPKFF